MTGRELAILAERYLSGELGFWEFMDQAPSKPNNSFAWDLVDMIEHEPKLRDKHGNLTDFGTKYLAQVNELIAHLKNEYEELLEK